MIGNLDADEFEESAKTAIRLAWNLLDGTHNVEQWTQRLLKNLVECLYHFKHVRVTEEVRLITWHGCPN